MNQATPTPVTALPADAPASLLQLEQLLRAAQHHFEKKQYTQAHTQLTKALALVSEHRAVVPPDVQLRLLHDLWRVSPYWWGTVQHGGLSLRRCKEEDAPFISRALQDPEFARRFDRLEWLRGDLPPILKRLGTDPPVDLGILLWTVCQADGKPLGIASLARFDGRSHQCEAGLGFPGKVPYGVAHKASLLMLHFAFFVAQFNKLYAYIYSDNEAARRFDLGLGFLQEGFLEDHYRLSNGHFVSVHAMGLTKRQLQNNTKLVSVAKRRLGVNWQAPTKP